MSVSGQGGAADDETQAQHQPNEGAVATTNAGRFQQHIKNREQQLDKCCMVIGRIESEDEEEEEEEDDDEEDEREPTMEQLLALTRVYMPKKFKEFVEEVTEQMEEIGTSPTGYTDDEDEAMPDLGFSFRMLQTRHSNVMHEVLLDNLKKVDTATRSGKWPEALCWWAAIVMAARNEGHWYGDTESPEVATSIYTKMRTQWMKLKDKSEEELGGVVLEGNGASVKTELAKFLQALADDMNDMGYTVHNV